MGRYFGTDGFRGEAGVALTASHAFSLGRFLGWYLGEKGDTVPQVLLGKDTRLSGYTLESALCGGLTASGANVTLLHVTTTPSLSYLCQRGGYSLGIMISASHNGFGDNGIKVFSSGGDKADEELLSLAEDYLDGTLIWQGKHYSHLPYATGERVGRITDGGRARQVYADHLISVFRGGLSGVRLALDCANGGSYQIAPEVFSALGAEVALLGVNPDGTNINRLCGSTDVRSLSAHVRRNRLSVGFAFDGDGDRCIAVDEEGREVDGDDILYLCACYMADRGELTRGGVVGTVMSNGGLEASLAGRGISFSRTPVGDRFVAARLAEEGTALGGEPSGHVIFSAYSKTGDGILTALKVLEVMQSTGKSLSQLIRGRLYYPQVVESIPVPNPRSAALSPYVMLALNRVEEEALSLGGRVLLRPSGTENVVRIMCEAPEEALCHRWVGILAQAVREAGRE